MISRNEKAKYKEELVEVIDEAIELGHLKVGLYGSYKLKYEEGLKKVIEKAHEFGNEKIYEQAKEMLRDINKRKQESNKNPVKKMLKKLRNLRK